MIDKRLAHSHGVIDVVKSVDHAAGIVGDSFNMKNFHHASFILNFGAITGDAVLKVFSGATAAAKTTSMAFKHRLGKGDQGAADADQFGDEATVVAANGLTLTAATYDNRLLLVEIEEPMIADAEEWVTLDLSNAASVLLVAVVALLSPRYSQLDVPTAI